MTDTKHKNFEITLAFAAVYILWGSTYLGIRFAIESFPPFFMAGSRFIIASVVLYIMAKLQGGAKISAGHWKDSFIVGGCLLLGGNGGVVWAEQYVPSGLTALLVATVPIWMVLFDWVSPHGKKPTKRVLTGIVLGFLGVAFMISPTEFIGTKGVNLLGAGALLFATLSWAFGSVYSRGANLPDSKLLTVAMEMFAGGVLLLIVSSFFGEFSKLDLSAISSKALFAWLYLIVFGSIVGFTSYIWLLDAAGPSRTSTYAYVNPAIAVFLGWALAGEELNLRIFISMVIIILAVFFIISQKNLKGYLRMLNRN